MAKKKNKKRKKLPNLIEKAGILAVEDKIQKFRPIAIFSEGEWKQNGTLVIKFLKKKKK